MKKVYLAGPITDISNQTALSWREYAEEHFKKYNIHALSPLRFVLENQFPNDTWIYDDKYITMQCKNDIIQCDAVLVNFIGANVNKISVGTVIEIAWADILNKPVVTVLDETFKYNYGLLKNITQVKTFDINTGINMIKALLA